MASHSAHGIPVCLPQPMACAMPNISHASGQTNTSAFDPVGGQLIAEGDTVQIGCDTGYVIDGDSALLQTADVSGGRTRKVEQMAKRSHLVQWRI